MTVEEAQKTFVDLIAKKGQFVNPDTCFYTNKSKRLTKSGFIYTSFLNMSEEKVEYILSAPINHMTTQILDKYLKSFYYLVKNYDNTCKLTVFDTDFDIKVSLIGGIDEWWKKVLNEYNKNN